MAARPSVALAAFALLLAAGPALAGDPQVRPGKWNPDKPPPGWLVVETDHYQVQSHVGEGKARRLADHLEGMLDLYREILPFRKRMPTFVLKIFEDQADFRAYSRAGSGALAYYDQGNRELVCYDTGIILGERDIPPEIRLGSDFDGELSEVEWERLHELFAEATDSYVFDLASVLSHEGWHQYFHYYTVSWVDMPSWIGEGLGDYFFTARRREDGLGYELGGLNHARLRVIRRAFEVGTSVSFGRLLEFAQADYYSNASVYYAQGWSMVHFLMENADRKHRELIPKLIKDFKRSKNFRKSTERVFKGHDLDELDTAWITWVLKTIPEDPLRTLAVEFSDKIGPEHLEAPQHWKDIYERHLLEELERTAAPQDRGPVRGDSGR
jgi:hypothetical protein